MMRIASDRRSFSAPVLWAGVRVSSAHHRKDCQPPFAAMLELVLACSSPLPRLVAAFDIQLVQYSGPLDRAANSWI